MCSVSSTDIRLHDVVPEVFAGGGVSRDSQVWHTDLVLSPGHIYNVEAASGRGKSSLCAYLYGLRHDYRGIITIGGEDVARWDIRRWCEMRRTVLAYLPQGLELFAELSALDNVLLKNRLTGCRTEAQIRADFGRLGIADRIDTPAGRLSVGQQQRVALLRALCQPFAFILLDEPASHLDEVNNRECARLVEERAAEQHAAVISTSVGNPMLFDGDVISLKL